MKTMQKEMVFRSIFRHTLALCLAVPFVGLAAPGYTWVSESHTTKSDGTVEDLRITLEQTVANGSVALFDKSTFSTDFDLNSKVAPGVSLYSNWSLSEVIVEVTATIDLGITVQNASTQITSPINAKPGTSQTVTLGSFTLDTTSLGNGSVALDISGLTSGTGQLGSGWGTASSYDQASDVATFAFSGKVGPEEVGVSNIDAFLGSGTGTLGASSSVGTISAVTTTGNPLTGTTQTDVTDIAASLSSLGLSYKIRYIVTPEPGTMALLLTGIPLLLVRRRKSLKK